MADVRESFPSLEDASGVGVPLSKSLEGDAASGKVGSTAFAFKDASGNLVLPQLDSLGRVVVTDDSTAATILRARGEHATGSMSQVDVTGASITLTPGKTYDDLSVIVSCRRGAYFQLQQIDDATTTTLADFILDAGQYTASWTPTVEKITAGASGTQVVKLVALNFNAISALRGTITIAQV